MRASVLVFLVLFVPAMSFGQDVDSLIAKGEGQVRNGKLAPAYATFKKALELEPRNPKVLNALAQVGAFLELWDESALYYAAYTYLEDAARLTEETAKGREKSEKGIPKGATLTVRITPSEGEIVVNGLPVGKGTVTLMVAPGKAYTVTSEVEDYHRYEETVTLGESETRVLDVGMKKIIYMGTVKLTLFPHSGVKIYVDAKYAGTSEKSLELTEGKHLICFKKDGYDRWWRYVVVPRKDSIDLEANLREASRPDESCEVMPEY